MLGKIGPEYRQRKKHNQVKAKSPDEKGDEYIAACFAVFLGKGIDHEEHAHFPVRIKYAVHNSMQHVRKRSIPNRMDPLHLNIGKQQDERDQKKGEKRKENLCRAAQILQTQP
ncbi:hypothetical protein D3C73_971960 [compost metagenome]